MSVTITCTAEEALKKLKDGNTRYLSAAQSKGDISLALRKKTYEEGQKPYAIIITCSDSRVIPESIFSAGIGELFVVCVAGNVIGDHQLGSIEYAVEHLGCRLIVVMGHDNCGAVNAAMSHEAAGNHVKFIIDEIRRAIGGETDNYKACCLNVRHSIEVIENSMELQQEEKQGLQVCGAMYHLEDGRVEFW